MVGRRLTIALLVSAFAVRAGGTALGGRCPTPSPSSNRFDIRGLVTEGLLRMANHGRDVLRPDGTLALPRGIKRVWIDVGAHHLETTRAEFERYPDLALVAIEPLAECWDRWPDDERLVGLPVAIFLERGFMDFHVNAADVTSSLAAGKPGSSAALLTRTVEVRRVPVLRLEDVLAALPDSVDIAYLKTDVQGVDLQVLQSAGERLRRVYRVRAEVIREALYESVGGSRPGTEEEMAAHMEGLGFRPTHDQRTGRRDAWFDMEFVNVEGWSWADRVWQDLRFGRPVGEYE